MRLFCSVACLIFLSAVSAAAESDAQSGKTLFQEKGCSHCHTLADAGAGGTIGPRLDGVGRRLKKDQIVHQITFGGNNMPPFGEILTVDEIRQLAEYLARSKKEIKVKP